MRELALIISHVDAPVTDDCPAAHDTTAKRLARQAVLNDFDTYHLRNDDLTVHDLASTAGQQLADRLVERQLEARYERLLELRDKIDEGKAEGTAFAGHDDIRFECYHLGRRESDLHSFFDLTDHRYGTPILTHDHRETLIEQATAAEDRLFSIVRVPVTT